MISSFLNGCLIGGILLGICFLIASISSKAEKEKTVEEALSRSGYKTFSDDLWLDSDFCIDKTQKLLLVARYGLTIIPASSLRNVSHQIIYDYKTENNASFSQGLADGVVSGITGVGIIREIREEQVEYVKEVILKIDLDYKGNFTKVISTNLETATKFYELLPSLQKASTPRISTTPSPTTTTISNPYQAKFKENLRTLFSKKYANEDIVFNIRDELAILKPSNLICITKLINGEIIYYIVPAFDICSYRKSNGNLYFSFKYDGELPDDEVHRMCPGMEVKVITATLEESEYVFSHIRTYLSVNKINHFD